MLSTLLTQTTKCTPLSSADLHLSSVVNFSSAFLSAFGSLCVILSYFFIVSRKHRQTLFRLVFYLALADFCASVTITISSGFILWAPHLNTHVACVSLRAIIQFFYVSSFLWTTLIAVHLFRSTLQKPDYKRLNLAYHIIAWGIPGIMTIVLVAGKKIERSQHGLWCHDETTFEWITWFAPLLISTVVSVILYILIWRQHRQTNTGRQVKASQLTIERRLSLFVVAFLICWIWDVIEHFRSLLLGSDACPVRWLWITHAVFTPLQGFLNSIVYGITNRVLVWRLFSQKRPSNKMKPKLVAINSTMERSPFLPKDHQSYYPSFGSFQTPYKTATDEDLQHSPY